MSNTEVPNGPLQANNGIGHDGGSGPSSTLNINAQQNQKNSSDATATDKGAAVDYIKNKYETSKQPTALHLPTTFREPKKLDVNWDKVVVEERRPVTSSLNVTDLLSCLNVQVNESKAQFEGGFVDNNSSGPTSPQPVNRQEVEKVAPPEITKSVRALFESGQVGKPQARKAPITLDIPQESGVYENNPTPLQMENLVRPADFIETNFVPKGATKDLLSQWNQKGSQDFKSDRKPINIREDDGRVLESEPVRRTDVVNAAADFVKEGSEVQKGTTRNLLDQWKVKGSEEFVPQRKAINISEAEGKVVESTPVVRTDVVRSDTYVPEGTEVQRGTTRNLLDQWKTKGTEEFKSERKPIKISEDEGRVIENEPVKRTDVVNAEYSADMDGPQVEKGMAKNLLNQWKTKGTEEFKVDRKPITIAEDDGRVIENEPVRRTDVVNANYTLDMELPQVEKGMAKNLLNQWKTKGTEEFKSERKPINIAEDDGRILENEPIKRTDVVNADYSIPDGPEVQTGTTKNLLNQWKVKGTEEFKVERKPVNLAEDQGQITENEPVRRTDVVNAEYVPEGTEVQKGTTKNLLSQWHNKQNEEFKVERKPVNLAEAEGKVVENEPVRRTDVVNCEQTIVPEGSEVQKGTTKSLVSQWITKGSEEFKAERKPITILEDEGKVLENEPVKRTDVVNAAEQLITSDMEVQKGTTRNLLDQWKVKGSEEFKAQKKAIVLAEDEGHVVENEPQPQREDVVRQVYTEDELVSKPGTIKNIREKFKEDQAAREAELNKPRDMIEIDRAQDAGVYENNPEVRSDVLKEEYQQEEVISAQKARSVRELWNKKEKEPDEARPRSTPKPVRFTPPRERTPPLNEEFKSTHTLTLSTAESSLPAYMTSPLHSPGSALQSGTAELSVPAYMTSPLFNSAEGSQQDSNPYEQYSNGYK